MLTLRTYTFVPLTGVCVCVCVEIITFFFHSGGEKKICETRNRKTTMVRY